MLTDYDRAVAKLRELRERVDVARSRFADIASDPVVGRVLRAVTMLPEADREVIARVLERDATWRRVVAETEGDTGLTVRPNPHASLYVHVFDAAGQQAEPAPLPRDLSAIRLGIERFIRVLPFIFQEEVHAQWRPAVEALVRAADADMIAAATRLAREVLGLIAEVEAEGNPSLPKKATG